MATGGKEQRETSATMSFPIVGIGASAGGLEAISELLASLPAESGLALLLVQHLDPGHESLLAEILAKKTAMPVSKVTEGMVVEPNRLYVIPHNASMAIAGGLLRLQSRNPAQGKHMPIDVLFHSLAEDQGPNAIGVVLSGSGSDGALGLQEIKGAGGITFAQDEASARFSDMPRAAIRLGCVDFILVPAEIGRELARIARHPYLNGAEPTAEAADSGEPALKKVFRLLWTTCGIDFSHYKRGTVQRRMARRMALHKLDVIADYLLVLEANPSEVKSLAEDLLVRVTGFFRDAAIFEGLTQTVFPPLLEGRSPKDPVRIWVPGCASGEEVYSIAICLVEYLGERAATIPLQIFGTDVSEAAIERARAGLYLENIAREVSSERLERFFVKTDAHYQIAKSIRDCCVFARQDVTRDPPFSKLDLVSCRNLLIYLDPALQKRIIPLFHYALKPQGYLMLGSSETIGPFADLFQVVDKKLKIYLQRPVPGRPHFEFTETHPAPRRADHPKVLPEPAPSLPDAERLQREADRLLLARYSPAGVLVDEALNILQFRGKIGPYLEPPSGPATLNLQKFARPGLLVALGAALGQVKQDGAPVRKAGLPLEIEGRRREITLEVIPVKAAPGENRYYLILFEEAVPALPPAGRPRPLAALWAELTRAARGGDRLAHTDQEAREVLQLKRELEATRDYIQRMIEEHEAANEELKSAQEELLSSNEEFQSTNEELETAKEELQSVNEELTTTSEELRQRNHDLFEVNDALTQARDYAEAIVETVRQPLLVLDGNLRVLRANRFFYQVFQTTPEKTENAFIYRLGNREWDLPALRQMLEEILPKDLAFQDYEVTQVFPAIGEKTMRLNARRLEWKGRTPALILLAIEDITAHKHTAEALQQARDELEMRVQERTAVLKAEILERARAEEALFAEKEQLRITLAAIGDGVITTGPQGRVESLNRVAEQLTGQTEAQAQGRPLAEVFKIVNDDTREPADDPVQRCLREGEIVGLADHSLLLRPDGTEIAIENSAAPILNRAGRMAGVVLIFRDVTEKRRNARELHYQASHDALTGLINRHEFERRLQRVLKTSNGEHALLYLDLDQFKIVNDTCGHTAGDELLRQLATLMATQVRKRDTLARLGGDEFGVLLEHCSVEQALRLAQTLQQTVQDFRFTCDNKHFTAGVSIGLVPIPQGGDTLAHVLSAADSACYAAKDKGRNRIHVYAASDEELTQRHGQMQWIPRLHQALADGHLRLYFQPIVPVTGEVTGGVHGELLLRLVGEDGQIVSPGSFLPAAERYHQVQPLDRWVIRAALAAMCTQAAPQVVNYGINLSGQSLGDIAFLDFVLEQLAQSGVPPPWICFEVTETAAIADLKHARHFIKTLKQRGCRFALDDFGSGLSSFSYLKTLPVDYLKIDGAFVRDMVADPIDCAMVEAIHRVGRIMGIKTIAESVENEAILEKLKAIGVDYAQGYGIAKPHPLS